MVEKAPNCQPLHTDDYGWENHRYESKHFRLAHVERYADGKIEVLHFTTFPHKWSPEPIFGLSVSGIVKIDKLKRNTSNSTHYTPFENIEGSQPVVLMNEDVTTNETLHGCLRYDHNDVEMNTFQFRGYTYIRFRQQN